MAIGFFLVNFAPAKVRQVFEFIEKYTPPIYVLFFVLVGAKLNIWNVTSFLGIIAIVYVLCRTIGKTIGSKLGAKLTKAPITVYKYLPFCLLSQAGVAIGLSIAAGQQFQDTIGSTIMLIVTATTFIVQILGPICVKYGVTKAEECGLDITEEDIMKQCKVSDVSCAGLPICDKNSTAIISENESLPTLINSFGKNHNQNYVVKTENGKLAGIITLEYLKESLLIMDFYEAMMAEDIMEETELFVTPEMPIPEVMNLFTENDVEALPILDKEGNVLGIAEKSAIEHYLHAKILAVHQKLAMLG
jgi:CBS domain-containing protein